MIYLVARLGLRLLYWLVETAYLFKKKVQQHSIVNVKIAVYI